MNRADRIWDVNTAQWIDKPMIDLPKTSDYKPSEVCALEYLRGVSRATKQAGLTVNVGHIDTAINKLLNEQEAPKIKLIQLLNKLQEKVDAGETELTLPIEDVRFLIQSPKFKV